MAPADLQQPFHKEKDYIQGGCPCRGFGNPLAGTFSTRSRSHYVLDSVKSGRARANKRTGGMMRRSPRRRGWCTVSDRRRG